MKDVRKLVPRTPPEGLLEWAAERHKELDQDGLLIETEWAQDWSLEVMLDEWAENRKVRAIRATCSACKESGLLWRGRDGRGEWGFIHPGTWTEGEGGEVCADGDKTTCPWCGESVIVRRKADVRKKGWFVAAERHVMSASVLGKDRLLTLTGWTVQRRITAAAGRQLVAIPAEAYVFSAEDCAQLMGWVNSYSGTTGYSIQYTRSWRQPKDWVERWGSERGVFGLTPALVADSSLPHCKLDRYMAEPRRHAARYPVAWLRLCQKHPNAESLLVHGLPDVLDELIAEQTAEPDWKKNKRGELELPEIRWSETRPAQMLGLTRDELAMARSRCWGTLFWRLFTQAKDAGETLTDADIAHAFYLGDENVLDLVGRGPVGKSLRYLLRQIERAGVEPEDEDPQPEGVIDVSILLDYWRMAELTGRDLADPDVRWPEDLLEAHDRMSDAVTQFEARELASKFRIRRKQLARYAFQWRGLLIRPAASQRELVAEGDACAKMQGLSLRNVAIQVRNSKKKTVYAGQGELLFTHFGLSGPLILSASAHMRDFDTEHYYINLDLKPALDEEKLDRRLLRDFEENANRDFHNVLEGLVPRLMVPVLVERTGIPAAEKVHSVTKAQRRRLLEVLKCLRIDIQGPRPVEEAIVTSGGIKVSEINPTTLESKKAPGVYFAGEVLDVDAYTGGFNLQIAWSTGHAAGEAAAQDIGGINP